MEIGGGPTPLLCVRRCNLTEELDEKSMAGLNGSEATCAFEVYESERKYVMP